MKYIREEKNTSRVKWAVFFAVALAGAILIGWLIGSMAQARTWDVEYPMANQHIELRGCMTL